MKSKVRSLVFYVFRKFYADSSRRCSRMTEIQFGMMSPEDAEEQPSTPGDFLQPHKPPSVRVQPLFPPMTPLVQPGSAYIHSVPSVQQPQSINSIPAFVPQTPAAPDLNMPVPQLQNIVSTVTLGKSEEIS